MSKKPSAHASTSAASGSASAATATAAAAVVDSQPFDEKKLKPIHEAIDAGNYKHGMKLLHGAILKSGKKPVLQTLLALCHAYSGQPEEAKAFMATLPPVAQLDMITFNTAILVYRHLNDNVHLIECYELALAKNPKDEEKLVYIYFIVLKTHDYAKLQTIAMKLYTTFKKDKYLVWSSLNLLLARRDTPSQPSGQDKMLQLLEMMLQRTFGHPNFARTMQPEELLVLLRVYNRQLKYADGLKLLESESGLAFKEKDVTEYLRIKSTVLESFAKSQSNDIDRSRILNERNRVFAELIAANKDDWEFLTSYIHGEIELGELQETITATPASSSSSSATAEATASATPAPTPIPIISFDERISQLRTFLTELQQKVGTKRGQPELRGPYLAEVELEFCLWRRATKRQPMDAKIKATTADSTALEKAIAVYFRYFGSKSCFFYDILQYVQELSHANRVRLTNVCMGLVPSLVDPTASSIHAVTDGVKNVTIQDGNKDDSKTDSSTAPAPLPSPNTNESMQVRRHQYSLSVQQLMRYNFSTTTDLIHPPTNSSATTSTASTTVATQSTLNEKDLESSGKSMFEQFLATTKLPSSLLRVQSERGLGDSYLILFAHHYFSCYLLTKQKKYLLDIIMGLELGLTKYSIHNYQFKLWLIRLYAHPEIGAFARSLQLLKTLDVKQIMLDTTLHLILEDSIRYGAWTTDTLDFTKKLISWHQSADLEQIQTMQFAFERSNYSKVLEFVEMRDRLETSGALYQAKVLTAYGGILALGIHTQTSTATTSTSSTTENVKIEKDLTSVHTYLEKARQELLTQYPTITDHSKNESMSNLILNNDFSMVTVWDANSSPLSTLLNRPAPAIFPSSFDLPGNELLQKKEDDTHTYHPATAHLQTLRFYRITLDLLWFMMEQQPSELRTQVGHLKSILTELNFLDFTQELTGQPQESLASFDDQHWRVCFLAMENSACVLECGVLNTTYLDHFGTAATPADEQDQYEQHALRWNNLQRQFSILTFLVDSITTNLVGRFYLPPPGASASSSEETRKVVYGLKDAEEQPILAAALRDLSLYGSFGLTWLLCCIQMWSTVVPSKKTFKKLLKKRGNGHMKELTPEEEIHVLEPILAVRLALASLIKAARASLATLMGMTKKLATRVPIALKTTKDSASTSATASTSSTSSTALMTSTYLDHKPTLMALQASENATIVQTVLQAIDQAHGQSGANLYQLLQSIEIPLQQIKL